MAQDELRSNVHRFTQDGGPLRPPFSRSEYPLWVRSGHDEVVEFTSAIHPNRGRLEYSRPFKPNGLLEAALLEVGRVMQQGIGGRTDG